MPTITINNPARLIASLPYMVGFTPSNSFVIVFMEGNSVVLTMRLDVPPEGQFGLLTKAVDDVIRRHGPMFDAAIVVLWQEQPDETLISLMQDYIDTGFITVRHFMWTTGVRWGHTDICGNPGCCPPDGYEVDPSLAADFVAAAVAPKASREEIEKETRPTGAIPDDGHFSDFMGQPNLRKAFEKRDKERDDAIERLSGFCSFVIAGLDYSQYEEPLHGLSGLLHDIRVRDTIMWDALKQPTKAWPSLYDGFAAIARASHPSTAAPACTLAAVLAYANGNGARSMAAIESALAADPAYSLALLIKTVNQAAIPPERYVETLIGVGRDVVRHGDPDERLLIKAMAS